MTRIPAFRYHPDPVATASARSSDAPCDICGARSGYRYAGPIVGEQADNVCLDCIASGAAARTLASPDGQAEFTDVGWGVPDEVPAVVLDELAHRTPGFLGWQQEHWLYHCADAAEFLGRAGLPELETLPDALASLRDEAAELGQGRDEADEWIQRLRVDGDLTAYLFRCLHCGTHLAYSDAN